MSDDVCLSCGPGERSPDNLVACIEQFKDQFLGEWAPRDGLTFCNIAAQTITAALQCPIPMALANEQAAWLDGVAGRQMGWQETTREDAILWAQMGGPCLVTWINPAAGGHGHIAILRPVPKDDDPARAPFIAQAGRDNFWCGTLARGFGHHPVRYWRHS